MPLFTQSENDILADILITAMRNTGVTTSSPGSKLRSVLEAIAVKLGTVSNQFEQNILQSYLDGAQGQYLDYIGQMMGIKRLGATPGGVDDIDKVLRFYRSDNSTLLTIPAGTIVSTQSGSSGVTYKTIAQVELPAGSDGYEVYVSAVSNSTGSAQNTAKDTLIYHDLTDQPGLSVTNDTDIMVAQDLEGDSNFKFRIANQVFNAESANQTAVRMAALNVPGVADVTMLPFYRGVGTFDILIKATTPTVPESLLNAVREALFYKIAQGVSFDVRAPRETGISMSLNITLTNPIDSDAKKALQSTVQQVVMNYLDNLDISEDLIINEIVQRVMAIDDNIKNIGSAGKPIQEILRWDQMDTDPTKRISAVVFNAEADPVDIVALIDEKFLAETDYVNVPIFVNVIE